ncbi:hypothetical protein TRFO_09494 [Tritrichomonas foetus]|uniref:Uncharacterized protein n=1 Tax=Tritrichomonas foetus TaxID=1144522 RepID=A0A1J4JEZ8_9EUKA|nr:hypothetical protein TRFO_09494 [Tritrichomonas foetus]|eukprot:OHS97249.1 hypothetical protein TRFO_09494 [Tritrichomonas foetus]
MRTKARKINVSILRSNLNKKLIQLQRIIYDLSSKSDNYDFQRKFLHDYFNPRIDNAINTYRDHISKMQKTSYDDYDFIVDRTDRFYQRKIRNLNKSHTEEIQKMQDETTNIVDELDQEKMTALETIKKLSYQIDSMNKQFNKMVDDIQNSLKVCIENTRMKGEKELKEEIEKTTLRDQKFIEDSEKHCQDLADEHKLMIEKIKNGYNPPTINIQTIISKTREIKRDINDGKRNVISMMSYLSDQMKQHKNNVKQLVQQMKDMRHNDYDKINELQNKMRHELKEQDAIISALKTKLNDLRKQQIEEIEKQNNLLSSLKTELDEEFENKKKNLNANNLNFESQIAVLKKSFDDKKKVILLTFGKRKKEIQMRIDEIMTQIEEEEKKFETQKKEFVSQLSWSLQQSYKTEVRSFQMVFMKNKETMKKEYEDQIKKLKEKILNSKNSDEKAVANAENEFTELNSQKEKMIENHQIFICEFDNNEYEEIKKIENEKNEKIEILHQQIDSMLSKEKEDNYTRIEQIKAENERKKQQLLKDKNNQYNNEMDIIKSKGFSRDEYLKMEQKYQNEYQRLIEDSQNMTPFIVNEDMFTYMTHVITDLENELEDHKIMVSSQSRLISHDYQDKIDQENLRFNNLQNRRAPSRARNQVIQSLKTQISNTIKEKEDKIYQLQIILAGFTSINSPSKKRNNTIKDEEDNIEYKNQINELHNLLNDIMIQQRMSIEKIKNEIMDEKNEIESEHSRLIKNIQTKICAVKESLKQQNSFFEEKNRQLNNTLQMNKMIYTKTYEETKRNGKCEAERMKAEFIEKEHLLKKKCSEQAFQNSRNNDSYKAKEQEEYQKHTKSLNDHEDQMKRFIISQRKKVDDLKREIKHRMDDMQVKKGIIVRKAGERPSRSCDLERIERLEQQLSIKTNQLRNSIQDMSEYRTLYVAQEKVINQHFGGMPDVGILQMNQRRPNISVA